MGYTKDVDDILIDASAIMAIILNEPNRDMIIKLTNDAMLLSPEVIPFEIGNALVNLYRRQKLSKEKVLEAYAIFITMPLKLIKVHVEKALQIACEHNIYAYDAYYLEAALRRKLPLITCDAAMKRIGLALNIEIRDKLEGGKII